MFNLSVGGVVMTQTSIWEYWNAKCSDLLRGDINLLQFALGLCCLQSLLHRQKQKHKVWFDSLKIKRNQRIYKTLDSLTPFKICANSNSTRWKKNQMLIPFFVGSHLLLYTALRPLSWNTSLQGVIYFIYLADAPTQSDLTSNSYTRTNLTTLVFQNFPAPKCTLFQILVPLQVYSSRFSAGVIFCFCHGEYHSTYKEKENVFCGSGGRLLKSESLSEFGLETRFRQKTCSTKEQWWHLTRRDV